MFPFPDIPNANPALRSQFDAQVGLLAQLSQRNCDLFERLSALNLQMARQAIDDAIDTGRELAACTDPFQMSATAVHRLQPAGEHFRSYQQELFNVLANTQMQQMQQMQPAQPTQTVREAASGFSHPGRPPGDTGPR
ncbi:phasin family protein [Massilia sp. ZL223]|uniref:phasin family protein n=1 Tax=Massilia sp. ZL223 TaxID=2824904 RepID=UPI001B83AD20|nr:phasin family protein [Massilia sp. ZL223]MBQ5962852.1 phasin family protein [Massilia sp. ZL223]